MVKGANDLIETQLSNLINTVESLTSGDCLSYTTGPIAFGADDAIRDAVETLSNRSKRRGKKIVIILETEGGFAEVARRISDTIRHHYTVVDFLIPSHAMSAGTILAMSGDSIYMNYYSVLGPIDPLVESRSVTS